MEKIKFDDIARLSWDWNNECFEYLDHNNEFKEKQIDRKKYDFSNDGAVLFDEEDDNYPRALHLCAYCVTKNGEIKKLEFEDKNMAEEKGFTGVEYYQAVGDDFALVVEYNGNNEDIGLYQCTDFDDFINQYGDTVCCEPDLNEIVWGKDLRTIETTNGTNGYPEETKEAIIGFETYEQAQEVAKEYHMNVEKFFRRDGWGMWQRKGEAFGPLEISADDFGDDYSQYTKADLRNFEELKKEVDEKTLEEIEKSEDDEIVITCEGRYYDTVKQTCMEFSEDSKTYAIGVIYNLYNP